MKLSRKSPLTDWRGHDARRIADAKVLREDKRPAEVGVIRFDEYGKRIDGNAKENALTALGE